MLPSPKNRWAPAAAASEVASPTAAVKAIPAARRHRGRDASPLAGGATLTTVRLYHGGGSVSSAAPSPRVAPPAHFGQHWQREATMALRINERNEGAVTILELAGKITGAAGETLAGRVEGLVGEGRRRLLLDLGGVPHIDSAGLGWLLTARSTVTGASGKIGLLNLNERVEDLMVTTKLEMVFDSFDSEADGMKSFA